MERLEQIEKLRERAQVTYDEAKEAYEQANGDLLDALIYLEKQGKVRPPKGDGYYRSEEQKTEAEFGWEENEQNYSHRDRAQEDRRENNFRDTLGKMWSFFQGLIQTGNSTSFEILKEKEHVASFPVTVLAVFLLFAPWITLPAIVVGLFFGFHYQFVRLDK